MDTDNVSCLGISIVLCSYNRSRALARTLDWIDALQRPDDCVLELIIVDNNSSDDTSNVIRGFSALASLSVTPIFEPRQGLSNARNAAIKAARGSLLAFIDDDCLPVGDWLVSIANAFSNNPDLDGAGGRVDLYDERDLPMTIRTIGKRQEANTRNLFALIPGCNMIYRSDAVRKIGWFDTALGPGTACRSAEDSDYIFRALCAGLKLEYRPEIRVFHAHGRRSSNASRELRNGYEIGRGAFYGKHILARDREVMRLWYWETQNLLRRLVTKREYTNVRTLGNLLHGFARYPLIALRERIRTWKENPY